MLQATRTANRKGLKKKQAAQSQQQHDHQHQHQLQRKDPRKSVRYGGGYNRGAYSKSNVKSQPHSPYTSHSSHFNSKRNKRKSTIFRPTHAGQSVGAMVEHSVFAQINNPHSTQVQKYEQYKQIKRRESISARKKREEKMIRKTVMMNAQQHQQLLNLVKNQNNTSNINENNNQQSTAPSSPDINAVQPPNNNNHDDNWAHRANTYRKGGIGPKMNINIGAGLIESKSRIASTVVTPINNQINYKQLYRAQSIRGTSIGDALGYSQNELDEYKTKIMSDSNRNLNDIKDINNNNKRGSLSVSATSNIHPYNRQHSNKNDTGPPPMMSTAMSSQSVNTFMNIQPKQLFTTPHSRRTSIRPPIQPLIQTHHQQQQPMIPITQMILMIFQSLSAQQKKELINLMNKQLHPQPNNNNINNNTNNNNIPEALKKATNQANFLPNAIIENQIKEPLLASRSIPVTDDIIKNKKGSLSFVPRSQSHTERTKNIKNASKSVNSTPKTSITALLKNRVGNGLSKSAQKLPLMIDNNNNNNNNNDNNNNENNNTETPQSTNNNNNNNNNNINNHELFEIKEASEQSKSKSDMLNKVELTDNLSWKSTDNTLLPSKSPNIGVLNIGGALSTIQSQYDMDVTKSNKHTHTKIFEPITPKSMISEEHLDSDVDIDELSNDIDQQIDSQLFQHMNDINNDNDPPIYQINENNNNNNNNEKKQKKMVHFNVIEEPKLINNESVSSDVRNAMEIMQPLFEENSNDTTSDYKKENDIILPSEEIQMAELNNSEDSRNDLIAPTPTKTPNTAPTNDGNQSPKELLLTERLSKANAFENENDSNNSPKEERQRLSSAELFAKDIIELAFEDTNKSDENNKHNDIRGPMQIIDSSNSDNDMDSNNSSITEEQEPNKYTVRLHPSRYQLNVNQPSIQHDTTNSGHSDESANTNTTNTNTGNTNVQDIETQRIGVPTPLHTHVMMQASMMDIGIDPDHENGETTDEDDQNYFGAGTPTAVREGTETIQKTLRAVWVRGHTSIGTLIHFILIVINLMAAVMFVAAIEGYENEGLEYFFTSAFLVDFCIRLYAAKSAILYLRSAKGIADFVSVMPGIILAISDFDGSIPLWTFSFVRAMRVLRILRLLAHMVNVEDVQAEELNDPIDIDAIDFMNQLTEDPDTAYKKNRGCFNKKFWIMSKVTYFKLTLVSYLLMVVFVGAGLFACVEGPQSETQTVSSFFESFYFIVVTITTVGYGDYSPDTMIGQICIILVIAVAFIVVPYRASVLAQLEFEYADQESEPSVMDFNMDALRDDFDDEEEDEGPQSFLGYCANCAGPRWTIGTQDMPISCMHCFHPVLTPQQVEEWFPDIAEALDEFITGEQNELLALMLDAKEGADNNMLPIFQAMVRGQIDPNGIIMQQEMMQQQQQQQTVHFNMNNPYISSEIQSQPGSIMNTLRSNGVNNNYTPAPNIQGNQYMFTPTGNQYGIDPQLLMANAFSANNNNGSGIVHNNIYFAANQFSEINNNNNNNNNYNNYNNVAAAIVDENINNINNNINDNNNSIDTGNELLTVDTITEEPTDLQMESPKDLFTKEENNNNNNNELYINKLNVLPEYENSNIYNTQNKSPISNISKSPKSKSKTKSTSKIKVTITPVHNDENENENNNKFNNLSPSMEPSETLSGYDNNNESDDDDDDDNNNEFETPEPNINDANILFEPHMNKEELIITPISTQVTPTSKSHHSRKATPAELPGVKLIKKFPLNDYNDENITIFDEEDEEHTPSKNNNNNNMKLITPDPKEFENYNYNYNQSEDDSYNDDIDNDEIDDEEKASNPIYTKSKSSGQILKHKNKNKNKNKNKKQKIRSETPKVGSIQMNKFTKKLPPMKGGSFNDYNYNRATSDEDNNDKNNSNKFPGLSIIIDKAPNNQRDRAKTTMTMTVDAIENHIRRSYNNNNYNNNNNNNNNKHKRWGSVDNSRLYRNNNNNNNNNEEYDDDEITPQEYEKLSLFFNRMGDSIEKKPKKRESSQNNIHQQQQQQQRHTPHRSSTHQLEMYKNTILESIANNNNNNHNDSRILSPSHKWDTSHRKSNNKKSVDWNVDMHDIEHIKSNSRMGLVFEQNKMMAKSMTDLFVANQMNNQPKKKGKKGKNNINPMKDYHTNKVLNQLETHFGSSNNIQLSPNPNNNNNNNNNNSKKSKKKKNKKKKKKS